MLGDVPTAYLSESASQESAEAGMSVVTLPAYLQALIGPPIEDRADPRCAYQSEEVSSSQLLTLKRFLKRKTMAKVYSNLLSLKM